MTAASTSTTTETRAETLERFEPKDAIPNDAFDAMILEWRDHPRVRVRGRGEPLGGVGRGGGGRR